MGYYYEFVNPEVNLPGKNYFKEVTPPANYVLPESEDDR